VDDARSAADLGARGATIGLVAVAGAPFTLGDRLGAHLGVSVGISLTRDCHCRPRHFGPVLRRASL